MALTKIERRSRIRKRIRKTISGNSRKPRMSVFRSNKQIYVQIIDDTAGKTLVAASSLDREVAGQGKMKKAEQARLVGKRIASLCKDKGIETVVFDRGGYLYHGRVKQLAEGAREGGLKF